jgi:hypothetical protein
MKRYLAAVGVGGVVFAAALGSAAALNINDPGVAQYGQSFGLACDSDGVTVLGYMTDSDAGAPSVSNGVKVTGIDSDCAGRTLVAGATKGDGSALARGYVVIPAGGGTVVVPWNIDGGPQVPYSQLGGIRLTLG